MVHIQIYGHIPFFFILGRGLFQCPPFSVPSFLRTLFGYDSKNVLEIDAIKDIWQ